MTYRQEQIKPYVSGETKTAEVERMFNGIAPSYDLLNHLLSFGIDRRWRREAIAGLKRFQPKHLLDIATGTGDFALLAAKMLQPESIVGADLSEEMMKVAAQKAKKEGLAEVLHFERQDCMSLTFPDKTFDALTVAYGLRNYEDLDRGLKEMRRVLRPGGRLVALELTTPPRFPMKQLFAIYSRFLMPLLGRLISGDGKAYAYLPATMEAFPQAEEMTKVLEKAGFSDVAFRRFTFGLCTLYTAQA